MMVAVAPGGVTAALQEVRMKAPARLIPISLYNIILWFMIHLPNVGTILKLLGIRILCMGAYNAILS
jgi:hypothetical protein